MSHGWIRCASWAGIDLSPFPSLKAWVDKIDARPAIQESLKIPEQGELSTL